MSDRTWLIDLAHDTGTGSTSLDATCSGCGGHVRAVGLGSSGELVQALSHAANAHNCRPKACGRCNGTGRVHYLSFDGENVDTEPCDRCFP